MGPRSSAVTVVLGYYGRGMSPLGRQRPNRGYAELLRIPSGVPLNSGRAIAFGSLTVTDGGTRLGADLLQLRTFGPRVILILCGFDLMVFPVSNHETSCRV